MNFSKIITGLLVLCTVLIGGCTNYQEARYATIDSLKMETVGFVHTRKIHNEMRTATYCSGVWVASDVILTANHCVVLEMMMQMIEAGVDPDDVAEAEDTVSPYGTVVQYVVERDVSSPLVTPDHKFSGTVIASDKAHDTALVRVSKGSPPHRVAPLARRLPRTGAPVHVIGHTIGLYWTYTPATFSRVFEELKDAPTEEGPFIELVGAMNRGNSGGGAWDENGNLIGIADILSPAPGISFFVHIDTIRQLMKDSKVPITEGSN